MARVTAALPLLLPLARALPDAKGEGESLCKGEPRAEPLSEGGVEGEGASVGEGLPLRDVESDALPDGEGEEEGRGVSGVSRLSARRRHSFSRQSCTLPLSGAFV